MDLPTFSSNVLGEPPTEPNFGVPRARRATYRGAMRDATALEAEAVSRVRLRLNPEHEEATRRWLAELVADSSRWEVEPPASETQSGWAAAAAA